MTREELDKSIKEKLAQGREEDLTPEEADLLEKEEEEAFEECCKMQDEYEKERAKRTTLQVFEDLARHPYRNAINDDGWECIKDDFPEDYEKVKSELKVAEILKEHLKVSEVYAYECRNIVALRLESNDTGDRVWIHLTKEQYASLEQCTSIVKWLKGEV